MLRLRSLLMSGLLAASALFFAACDLQQDIDVDLPAYPPQLVVECYLENGKVPQLTVTETAPYLSNPLPTVPSDVTVVLSGPGGQRETLRFQGGIDPVTKKLYTHRGRRALTIRPGDTWQLEAADTQGRRVTGTATMPATVGIDNIEWRFNDEPDPRRRALVLVTFQDPAGTPDYYRLQIHRDSIHEEARELDRDFDDQLFDGQRIPMGTSYEFERDDTLLVTLYHFDLPYYRFLRSIDDAQSANGNPFGQPAQIQSTVQGGLGVFTILNYQRRQIIVR